MTVAVVLGWLAAFVGIALGVPQLVHLWRTRNVEGLSALAWQATLTMNLVWGSHGIRLHQANLIGVNIGTITCTGLILILLARELKRSLLAMVLPCLAAAAVTIVVDIALGSAAFGVAAIIIAIVASVGQTVQLVRAAHVRGVSPVFMVMAVVNQVLWLVWGLLIVDPGTIMTAGTMAGLTGFNLLWFGLRRLGLRAFFASVSSADDPAAMEPILISIPAMEPAARIEAAAPSAVSK